MKIEVRLRDRFDHAFHIMPTTKVGEIRAMLQTRQQASPEAGWRLELKEEVTHFGKTLPAEWRLWSLDPPRSKR